MIFELTISKEPIKFFSFLKNLIKILKINNIFIKWKLFLKSTIFTNKSGYCFMFMRFHNKNSLIKKHKPNPKIPIQYHILPTIKNLLQIIFYNSHKEHNLRIIINPIYHLLTTSTTTTFFIIIIIFIVYLYLLFKLIVLLFFLFVALFLTKYALL